MGTFFIIGSLLQLADFRQLSQDGITTKGVIVDKMIEADDGQTTSHSITYQFTAESANGRTQHKNQHFVDSMLYYSLESRQNIDILYVPSNPENSMLHDYFLHGQNIVESSLVFLVLGSIMLFLGLLSIVKSTCELKELFQLRLSGQKAQGIIFDLWQEIDDAADNHAYVAYAFKVDPSRELSTHAVEDRELFDRCQIGDVLTVRFVPSRPTICEARRA